MTDRHAGYIVTLEQNIREDDAQPVIAALRMVKGVLSVEPVVADIGTHMGEDRARHEFLMKLYEFAREVGKR